MTLRVYVAASERKRYIFITDQKNFIFPGLTKRVCNILAKRGRIENPNPVTKEEISGELKQDEEFVIIHKDPLIRMPETRKYKVREVLHLSEEAYGKLESGMDSEIEKWRNFREQTEEEYQPKILELETELEIEKSKRDKELRKIDASKPTLETMALKFLREKSEK